MDIQVGDRVTYKYLDSNKEVTTIVACKAEVKDFQNMQKESSGHQIKILKIERPKYEVIEEKKELLTEEEKEFLKNYIQLTALNFNYIKRDYDYLYLHIKGALSCMEIELNDCCFNNLETDIEYTLSDLGLED